MASASSVDALAVDAARMLGIAAPSEEQLAWNHRALDLAERSPEPRARAWRASILNNLGWSLFEAGNYAEALSTFERGLSLREELGRAGRSGSRSGRSRKH
jgi:hypothetical protein